MPTQPFNALGQFFCGRLDISKQLVVVGSEWSFPGDPIKGSCALDGFASQPPPFCLNARQQVVADPVFCFRSRFMPRAEVDIGADRGSVVRGPPC